MTISHLSLCDNINTDVAIEFADNKVTNKNGAENKTENTQGNEKASCVRTSIIGCHPDYSPYQLNHSMKKDSTVPHLTLFEYCW